MPQRQRRQQSHEHTTYFVVVIIIIIINVFVVIVIVIVIILLLRHAAATSHWQLLDAVIVLFRPLLNPPIPHLFSWPWNIVHAFLKYQLGLLHNQVQLEEFSTLLSHDVIGSCCQLALTKYTKKVQHVNPCLHCPTNSSLACLAGRHKEKRTKETKTNSRKTHSKVRFVYFRALRLHLIITLCRIPCNAKWMVYNELAWFYILQTMIYINKL